MGDQSAWQAKPEKSPHFPRVRMKLVIIEGYFNGQPLCQKGFGVGRSNRGKATERCRMRARCHVDNIVTISNFAK